MQMMRWIRRFLGASGGKAPAPSAMLHRGGDGVYVLHITGVLDKSTVDRIQAVGAQDFDHGRENLKVLIVLKEFQGWKRGDAWNDIDFFAQYGDKVAGIAVVGDVRWKAETMAFLAAGHRAGEVRFFPEGLESTARAWLLRECGHSSSGAARVG